MNGPYSLPPYTNSSSKTISSSAAHSGSFYTMKMYETPSQSQASINSGSRYLPPQEIPYHNPQMNTNNQQQQPLINRNIHSNSPISSSEIPTNYNITDSSKGSAAGIVFTNPFTSSPPPTQAPSLNNVSNSNINSAGTFQPLYATFGPEPVFVSCPYCQHTDETQVEPATGISSLLCCLILPVFGLFLKSKKDTRHRCKCCFNVIGVHYADL